MRNGLCFDCKKGERERRERDREGGREREREEKEIKREGGREREKRKR